MAQQSPQFFVGGNFKMNGNKSDIQVIIDRLNKAQLESAVEVVIAPSTPYLSFARELVKNNVEVAAQNVYNKPNGAWTGEVSVSQLQDIGIKWFVAEKTKAALDGGLSVILCIGESLKQREAGETNDFVIKQLEAVAAKVQDWSKVIIAYEPIWAIGTGKTATTEQAEEVHAHIRSWLEKKLPNVASTTRIIYGGSVTPDGAEGLASQKNIDGFLVGGASLKPGFDKIINAGAVKGQA